MGGHHLILGEIGDFITGEIMTDTHDERYRQKIARFLVADKGYPKTDIHPRNLLIVAAGNRKGRLWVDFTVTVDDHTAMVIKYGPGSLVTRYRPTLAISRLVAPYQVPVVVVTNGESADILDGETGKLTASGFDRIPSRHNLAHQLVRTEFSPISLTRAAMEARIVYAFEIDGGCPCDDSACRIA
ncbi:type I restriction enzyme HsdR N-terminal domain-containing protein [Desulfosarcina sp.]|uniref:type I restriction enzyme HsdR N-terminal domain-containing protein n=1 Tax=Desulfosarcina sp. TaxID=2027861 RepID=UPI0029A3B48A|nr:type I restriction enzyme HsdR N-terminal domain-containing protein [Desulfosarcina sp.]MDX2451674.1 type I restriction enzyme HsdR N-terminal domain-containing protein [Desulfosarcina sp.]MDX2489464.1 type I restriction enzyme HsdR N-terminal domain-containing protein [Desulfosarcina sp.]